MKITHLHASGAHRWRKCHGSVLAEMTAPVVAGDGATYMLEGSAAHKLFETCLKKKQPAGKYIGEEMRLARDKTEWEVDEEMADHVQDGLDLVRRKVGNGTLWSEQEVGLRVGKVVIGGTLDAGWYGKYAKDPLASKKVMEWQLHILDLKYGQGALVEAHDNDQIKVYAKCKLEELFKKQKPVDSVHLWIYQPRVEHVDGPFRHVVMEPYDLIEFDKELDADAAGITAPNPKRTAGSWCAYCKASPTCPTSERMALRIMRNKFSKEDKDRVGELLMQSTFMATWLKSLKELGTQMGLDGEPPTGFVMGRGHRSRRWQGEKEEYLKKIGPKLKSKFQLGEDQYAPRKLLGPAKVRAMLKNNVTEKGLEDFDKLWFWTPGRERLQPENNARHAPNLDNYFDDHGDGAEE